MDEYKNFMKQHEEQRGMNKQMKNNLENNKLDA